MWKYRSQTIISLFGLAVGFTCFALATFWMRYEMTFDVFHKDANRMYVVYRPALFAPTGIDRKTPYALAAYLKEMLPEIEDAIPLTPSNPNGTLIVNNETVPALTIQADTPILRMFDVKILEGNADFLIPGSNTIAITQEKANLWFGTEQPIGKTVYFHLPNASTICAIISDMSKRSNYAYDCIASFKVGDKGILFTTNTVIKLVAGTNVKAFEEKLSEIQYGDRQQIKNMTIKPLTKLRYVDPDVEREVKFQHIVIFFISGLLVIVCSLFNYLTLFMNRFRIRQKEFALRTVCGAQESSLFLMLLVEFMLTLVLAVLLGLVFTQSLLEHFLVLSVIKTSIPAIYSELLIYTGSIIAASLLLFQLLLFIFRRRSLNLSIRMNKKTLFRKVSIIGQLFISIGLSFCTILILKQMYFLHHTTELGFSFQNRGVVLLQTKGHGNALTNHLKQIP